MGYPLPRDVPYGGSLAVKAARCPTCPESPFWAQVCPGQVKVLPLPVCKPGDPSRAALLLTVCGQERERYRGGRARPAL